ncbi:MAG: hypothetical protein HY901_14075, partial [Deltaproteobacteria bacterium]|nr:hypothetical protein [Deltaproteobacteria bacterium]
MPGTGGQVAVGNSIDADYAAIIGATRCSAPRVDPMTFRRRILVVLALAGVLPVVLQGTLSYRASREQLAGLAENAQAQRATDLAQACARLVFHGVESVRLAAGYLPLEDLAPQEIPAILSIPFRQLPDITLLALVDGSGKAIAPAVYSRVSESGKPAMDEASLQAFSRRVPAGAALSAGSAIGVPYPASPPGAGARVALAVRIGKDEPRLLVAELSLREIAQRLELLAAQGERAAVFDASGALVLSAGQEPLSAEEGALVREG